MSSTYANRSRWHHCRSKSAIAYSLSFCSSVSFLARPRHDVVGIDPGVRAAGEAAALVAELKRAAERGRDRPASTAEIERVAAEVLDDRHHGRVAGKAVDGCSRQRRAVLEGSRFRGSEVAEGVGLDVEDDLDGWAARLRGGESPFTIDSSRCGALSPSGQTRCCSPCAR
jgi:hypothetical protein